VEVWSAGIVESGSVKVYGVWKCESVLLPQGDLGLEGGGPAGGTGGRNRGTGFVVFLSVAGQWSVNGWSTVGQSLVNGGYCRLQIADRTWKCSLRERADAMIQRPSAFLRSTCVHGEA
jgi:hypothetical protein